MGPAQRIFGALALLLTLVGGSDGTAFAHAVLLDARPAPDAVLDEPPGAVILTFNEAVRPVFVRILDAAGTEVEAAGPPRAVDRRVELPLPELALGGYIVSWRVVSVDSHPVGGSFRFAIGAAPPGWGEGPSPDDASERELPWRIAFMLNRAVFLVALLSAAGGAWFLLLVAREPALAAAAGRWAAAWALVAALLGAWLVPLQGALLLAPGPTGLLDPAVWGAGLDTGMGGSVLLAVFTMALLALGLKVVGPAWAVPLGVFALVGAGSLALAGHAATAEPRALTVPALALHAVAVAFWLGSLWPLLVAVRHLPADEAAAHLVRFSRLAMAVVVVLVVAGLALAIVQVEGPRGLVASAYGWLLLAKVAVVALVLALATANKWRHTPALARGAPAARNRLDRNIRLEIGGLVLAVALVAAMGQSVPPRALHQPDHAAGHAPEHAHDAHHPPGHAHHHPEHEPAKVEVVDRLGRRATIQVDPGRRGHNVIEVALHSDDGTPITPLEARIRLALPERGLEPVVREMDIREGGARYAGSDMVLSGRWSLRVEALVTDFDRAIFGAELSLR